MVGGRCRIGCCELREREPWVCEWFVESASLHEQPEQDTKRVMHRNTNTRESIEKWTEATTRNRCEYITGTKVTAQNAPSMVKAVKVAFMRPRVRSGMQTNFSGRVGLDFAQEGHLSV